MAASIGKFAPSAIVLAAVGYCCWPYVEDPGQRPKAEDRKLPEITASVLAPKIDPAPGRDPFGMTGDVDMFKTIEAGTAKKDAIQPAGATGDKQTNPATDKGAADKSKSSSTDKAADAAKKNAELDLKLALNSLALNATFLRGNHRVAIINSELYVEGESLDKANFSIRSIKVAKVLQHKVLLERQGLTVELSYPGAPSKPDVAPLNSATIPTARSVVPTARPVSLAAPSRNAAPTASPRTKRR